MILSLNQFCAYICEKCAEINIKKVDIFKFSGKRRLVLGCNSCGSDCCSIHEKKDRYVIDVMCPVCNENHEYTLKKSSFWNCSYISFKCQMSGIDIFFLGTEENINAALKSQEEMLGRYNEDIINDFIDEINNFYGGDADKLIRELVETEEKLYGLWKQGKINCVCGSKNIDFKDIEDMFNEYGTAGIMISCNRCGRQKKIDFGWLKENAEKINGIDKFTL